MPMQFFQNLCKEIFKMYFDFIYILQLLQGKATGKYKNMMVLIFMRFFDRYNKYKTDRE